MIIRACSCATFEHYLTLKLVRETSQLETALGALVGCKKLHTLRTIGVLIKGNGLREIGRIKSLKRFHFFMGMERPEQLDELSKTRPDLLFNPPPYY